MPKFTHKKKSKDNVKPLWECYLEKNKLEDMVINAFRCIFQRAKKPRHLRTDRGGELLEEKYKTILIL